MVFASLFVTVDAEADLMRHALAALALIASPAAAQNVPCAPLKPMLDNLSARYGETPQFAGVLPTGARVVAVANGKTGTFTVIIQKPDGMACMILTGDGWIMSEPAVAGGKS